MATTRTWTTRRADPERPVVWTCPFVDDLGLPCRLGVGHDGNHEDSGLRAWLETTTAEAFIRTYRGEEAGTLADLEAPAIIAFGFRAIAHEDTEEAVEVSAAAIAVLGLLAKAAQPAFERRLTICYARSLGPRADP